MAGSAPKRSSTMGIRAPNSPATTRLITIAVAITTPSSGSPNQSQAMIPIRTAKDTPFNSPTSSSLVMKRRMLRPARSFIAMARTATVRVWVPALPPIEATIGMSTARATIS